MANFVSVRRVLAPLAMSAATAAFLIGGSVMAPAALAQGDTSQSPPAAKGKLHRAAAAREATSMRPASVEQRIQQLRAQLKITQSEESDWQAVANAMRQNAKDMEQLVQQTRSESPRDQRNALEDLQTYQKFADAHSEGLRRLTTAFETLYNAMPSEQKHNADQVFRSFERQRPAAHS